MIEKLKHKYALSENGAKNMIKALWQSQSSNLVLMLPVGLLYQLTSYLLDGKVPKDKLGFFIGGIVGVFLLVAVTTYFQYNATFFSTYVESGVRRRALAESFAACHFPSSEGRSVRSDEYDHVRLCIARDRKLPLDSGADWFDDLHNDYCNWIVVLQLEDGTCRCMGDADCIYHRTDFEKRSEVCTRRRTMTYKLSCLDGIQEDWRRSVTCVQTT